jgi:hypothetical protein
MTASAATAFARSKGALDKPDRRIHGGKHYIMRKLVLIVIIAATGFLPAAAFASQPLVLPVQSPAPPASDSSMDPAKIIAIGAGVIIGASVLSSTLPFRGATLLGAVAGGLLGNWWYGDRSDIALLQPRKVP